MWTRLATAIVLLAPLSAAGAQSARATLWPRCALTHNADFFDGLGDMPAIIQADVRGRLGAIAEPGQPFNSGDVGDGSTPTRRFLRGVRSGGLWFIWYEHGGIGLHRHVLAYVVGESGIAPHRQPAAAILSNLVGDPCRATDAVLDGVFAASHGEY